MIQIDVLIYNSICKKLDYKYKWRDESHQHQYYQYAFWNSIWHQQSLL